MDSSASAKDILASGAIMTDTPACTQNSHDQLHGAEFMTAFFIVCGRGNVDRVSISYACSRIYSQSRMFIIFVAVNSLCNNERTNILFINTDTIHSTRSSAIAE